MVVGGGATYFALPQKAGKITSTSVHRRSGSSVMNAGGFSVPASDNRGSTPTENGKPPPDGAKAIEPYPKPGMRYNRLRMFSAVAHSTLALTTLILWANIGASDKAPRYTISQTHVQTNLLLKIVRLCIKCSHNGISVTSRILMGLVDTMYTGSRPMATL